MTSTAMEKTLVEVIGIRTSGTSTASTRIVPHDDQLASCLVLKEGPTLSSTINLSVLCTILRMLDIQEPRLYKSTDTAPTAARVSWEHTGWLHQAVWGHINFRVLTSNLNCCTLVRKHHSSVFVCVYRGASRYSWNRRMGPYRDGAPNDLTTRITITYSTQ